MVENRVTEQVRLYNSLNHSGNSSIVYSKNEKWRSRRRLITPSFHDNQLLNNFMLIFNEQASVLVDRLDRLTKQNKTHDLYPYISSCTLDIITGSPSLSFYSAQRIQLDDFLV